MKPLQLAAPGGRSSGLARIRTTLKSQRRRRCSACGNAASASCALARNFERFSVALGRGWEGDMPVPATGNLGETL